MRLRDLGDSPIPGKLEITVVLPEMIWRCWQFLRDQKIAAVCDDGSVLIFHDDGTNKTPPFKDFQGPTGTTALSKRKITGRDGCRAF